MPWPAGVTPPPCPAAGEAEWACEVRDRDTGVPSTTCRLMEPGNRISVSLPIAANGTTVAVVTVDAGLNIASCEACRPLPWVDEIVLTRGGQVEPEFIGPIVHWEADSQTGTIVITAKDRSVWLTRGRVLRSTVAYDARGALTNVDAHAVFADLWAQGEEQNPTGLILTRVQETDYPIRPFSHPGDALGGAVDDLAALAVDWTVRGLHVYYGAPELQFADLPPLNDTSFEPAGMKLTVDGESIADQVTVHGREGVEATVPPTIAEATGDWGLHWAEVRDDTIATVEQADRLAASVAAAHQRPAVRIDPGSAGLSRRCPVCPSDLLPGRIVPIVARFYGEDIVQRNRVTELKWTLASRIAPDGRWVLAEVAVEPGWADVGVTAS